MWFAPQLGLYSLIQALRDNLINGASIRLFKSAHTPGYTDVLSTYTAIESDFVGYAPQTPVSGWSGAMEDAEVVYIETPLLYWPVDDDPSGQEVYGYFVVDADDYVLFAEEFATPQPLAEGVPFALVARFKLFNPP